MDVEAEVGLLGMTNVRRVPSSGMQRGTSNPSSSHNRSVTNTEERQKRKEHNSNAIPKPKKNILLNKDWTLGSSCSLFYTSFHDMVRNMCSLNNDSDPIIMPSSPCTNSFD